MSENPFERALLELSKNRVRTATKRALDKAATSTVAFISKEVRAKYKVKAADVKAAIKIGRVSYKGAATLADLKSTITITQKGLPLIQFGARPKAVYGDAVKRRVLSSKGVRTRNVKRKFMGVTVNVGGQRVLVKGGFLATMRGKENVYKRSGPKRDTAEYRFGPSVRDMVSDSFLEQAVEHARERVAVEFRQSIEFELNKPLIDAARKGGG